MVVFHLQTLENSDIVSHIDKNEFPVLMQDWSVSYETRCNIEIDNCQYIPAIRIKSALIRIKKVPTWVANNNNVI
jgi:hypothetical protein